MSEETLATSQSGEESTTFAPERDAETEALYASFDIKPAAEKKEIEFPDLTKGVETQTEEVGAPPAIEETKTDSKKITVKFNKEDVEIDETQVPELLQKGLALDKQREIAKQRESELDRAAILLGYKDHADLSANFDQIEQQRVKTQEDQFKQLKQDMIDEFQNAGGDPAQLERWIETHPLLKEAQSALDEKQRIQQQTQQRTFEQQRLSAWEELYKAFPDIVEDSKKFTPEGGRADFYTPEMESMVNAGYKPVDAYKLAHMDKIQTQSKKQLEQKLIKQQHLGTRSQVEGQASSEPDNVTLLPEQMALAAEFGVKIDGVRNQQKILSSRR